MNDPMRRESTIRFLSLGQMAALHKALLAWRRQLYCRHDSAREQALDLERCHVKYVHGDQCP